MIWIPSSATWTLENIARVRCLFTACLQEWTIIGWADKSGCKGESSPWVHFHRATTTSCVFLMCFYVFFNLASGFISTERPPLRAIRVRWRRRRQLGQVGNGEGGNFGVFLVQPEVSVFQGLRIKGQGYGSKVRGEGSSIRDQGSGIKN